ncbi:MAG: PQQ-binding-like beta-propeller repeat protein [Synergistaceae bacterium]|nr:PQQ-binding-like beta-propeller repeat protein [Synergistaceae bacterium]
MLKKLLLSAIMVMFVSSIASAWSGNEVWRSAVGASVTTDVVFDDGVVYLGDESGIVYALNAENGNILWSRAIGGTAVGKPVIIENSVVCAGRDGVLCAFNKKNGDAVWTRQPNRQDGSDTFADGPAAGGGKVFIGDGSGKIYAMSAATGAVVWSWQTSIAILTAPLYSDGILYVVEQNALFSAIDANTGKKLWGGGAGAAINTPTISSNKDHVYFSSEDGSMTSVKIKEKSNVWKVLTGTPISTAPEIDGGKIFAGTAVGNIIALSADNGGLLWNTSIGGGNVNARPIAAGGLLFAGSGDGTLYAIETNNGKIMWSSKLGLEINGAVCFNNGVLYAGSSAGEVTAFK